jgi:hypothetical protein
LGSPFGEPFFVTFGLTNWGTGRWKGWGLGRAEPGKKTKEQSPPTGHCFPQPREKVENGCFYDDGNCFSLPWIGKTVVAVRLIEVFPVFPSPYCYWIASLFKRLIH